MIEDFEDTGIDLENESLGITGKKVADETFDIYNKSFAVILQSFYFLLKCINFCVFF